MNLQYGIVVLNYNTYEDTINCVNSIQLTHNILPDGRIYIVDNNSPDGSGVKLQGLYSKADEIEVILSLKNLGFSGGNNIGINAALRDRCKYVFLLNSDVILINDVITEMLKCLNYPNVVACCPAVFNVQNFYVQYAKKGLTLSSYLFDKKLLKTLFPKFAKSLRFYQYEIKEDFFFAGMGSGCCFALESNFIISNKCLDPTPFMYYEEDILAHIISRKNLLTCISSQAKVKHYNGISTGKISENKLQFTRFYRWTSSLYVLRKYANVNSFICGIIAISNILIWALKSINNNHYKDSLSRFLTETHRAMRG